MRSLILASWLLGFLAFEACAEPQAPVVWGEARLLMNGPQGLNVFSGVFAQGDTLVLAGTWFFDNDTRELATACVSGDNGQTWSPWHNFLTPDSVSSFVSFGLTSGGLYACAPVQGYSRGLYHSTDLGQTWLPPVTARRYMRIADTRGDTIWCSTFSLAGDTVFWTTDGGQNYSPGIGVNLNQRSIDDLSVSDTAIISLSRTVLPGYLYLTTYGATAGRFTGFFGTPFRLDANCQETFSADVDMDGNGTGMILSCGRYHSFFPGCGAMFLMVTRDHGLTWSDPDTVQPVESGFDPLLRHDGHVWLAAWFDTSRCGTFEHWGAWYTLSANNGRSWYPARQGFGTDFEQGDLRPLDLHGDRIRIYEPCLRWNGIPGRYYLQWEGQIQRDSLPPIISSATELPALMPADTSVTFAVSATDNDSLWQMMVVLFPPAPNDSIEIGLTRGSDSTFRADWTIPYQPGPWHYYYRAEDMWENVSVYPDTGVFSFHTTGWNAAPSVILPPSSFAVRVYPNPCNGWPRIELAAEWFARGGVKIAVFDVLGRKVAAWDAASPGAMNRASTAALASGVYLVRVEGAGRSVMRKVMVLK